MRRALYLVTVLVVVALSVTAMPAAASTNTTVAPLEHSTNEEFEQGDIGAGLEATGNQLVWTGEDAETESFTSSDTWTAPSDGTVTFEMWGPGGGDGGFAQSEGGTGGYGIVEVDVEAGDTFTIVPGERGGDGSRPGGGSGGSGLYDGGDGGDGSTGGDFDGGGGGGGGGDSGITDDEDNLVASAGGGGGASGGSSSDSWSGAGGGGAQGGSDGEFGGGESGGGPGNTGGDGGDAVSPDDDSNDGGDGSFNTWQGTEIDSQSGGGNSGDGEIQATFSPESATYTSDSHEITDPIDGFVDIDELSDMSATVTWQEYNGDEWTVVDEDTHTTPGNYTTPLSGSGEYRAVIHVEVTGDNPSFALDAEGITFDNALPEIEDPEPVDETVDDRPVVLSVNVSDATFGTIQGDEVTVTFYDGDDEVMGTDTLTENGTASVEYDNPLGGDNDWYAVAEDDHGGDARSPETGTHTFQTPGEIEIRDEETLDLLDDEEIDIEVRFFQEDEETVYSREAENGVVDMAGLPADVEFVAAASTEDYHDRRIIIPDLFEQQTIYLLNESADTVQIDFQLEDRTRDFDPGDTKLRIMRAVGPEGEDQTYEVIAGDYFGATGSFPVDLARDDRYRLEIENREGQIRTLGSFTPVVSQVETLEVGTVTVGAQVDSGYVFDTRTYYEDIDDENDVEILEVGYVDREGLTESVEWELRYQSNETVVHGPITWTWGPDADQTAEELLTEGIDYPADAQLEIAVTIERDGETHERIVPVGGLSPLDWPVNAQWLAWFGFFTLVGVAALFGGTMSRTGAVIVVVVAFGLSMLGVIALSPLILSFALVAAIMFKVAERGGP